VLTGVYDRELRASGLQATQFALLATIAARPGSAQERLGRWLAMEQSTLSRNLQGLVRKRWIVSRLSEGSRATRYVATAAGRAALDRARPGWQRAQARVKRALGEEWEHLGRLLDKLAMLAPTND
jgi:DNA-binding MarR family transcriptional regulator